MKNIIYLRKWTTFVKKISSHESSGYLSFSMTESTIGYIMKFHSVYGNVHPHISHVDL